MNGRRIPRFFFEPIGKDGWGRYTLVDPSGLHIRNRYRVVNENSSGTRLVVENEIQTAKPRRETFLIDRDGLHAQHAYDYFGDRLSRQMEYIDAKTAPDPIVESEPAPASDGSTVPKPVENRDDVD